MSSMEPPHPLKSTPNTDLMAELDRALAEANAPVRLKPGSPGLVKLLGLIAKESTRPVWEPVWRRMYPGALPPGSA